MSDIKINNDDVLKNSFKKFQQSTGSSLTVGGGQSVSGSLKPSIDKANAVTGSPWYIKEGMDVLQSRVAKAEYYDAKKKSQEQGPVGEFLGFASQAVAGEIVLGTLAGAGYLLDFSHWGNVISGGEGEWGNWFSDLMEEGKEGIRTAVPIYQDPDNAKRNTFQNMLHGDGWWAENGVSVASTVSIMIPVMGWARGVGLAGKAMNAGVNALRVGKAGTNLAKGVKTLDKVMDLIPQASKTTKLIADGIHKGIVSRHIESQMEASQVYKDRYDYYREKGLDEDKAKQAAGAAAYSTYKHNWAMLLTDIPQYILMGKSGSALKNGLGSKVDGWVGESALKGFAAKTLPKYAGTSISEGFEEAYQFVVSEEGKYMGDIKAGLRKPNESTFGQRMSKYMDDSEMWTSALFGALGGAGMTAAHPRIQKGIAKLTGKADSYLTDKEFREQEVSTRFARVNAYSDILAQAVASNNTQAIKTAKDNMAVGLAIDAARVNNWPQARESFIQMKNATEAEKIENGLQDDFIDNIDSIIPLMDKAVELYETNRFKYPEGLDRAVTERQLSIHSLQQDISRQGEKVEGIAVETPGVSTLSGNGRAVYEANSDILALEQKVFQIENFIEKTESISDRAKEVAIRSKEEAKAKLEELRASITPELLEGLTAEDKSTLASLDGGSHMSYIQAKLEREFMDLSSKVSLDELNYFTSREGIRKYKQDKEAFLKQQKAEFKAAKVQAKKEQEAAKAKGETVEGEAQEGGNTEVDMQDPEEIHDAITKGTISLNDLDVDTIQRYESWKSNNNVNESTSDKQEAPTGDYSEENQGLFDEFDETTGSENNQEETEATENEEVQDEQVEDPIKAKSTESKTVREFNPDASDFQGSYDSKSEQAVREEQLIQASLNQLAWLSVNNEQTPEEYKTPENIALAKYLEDPNTSIEGVSVVFGINEKFLIEGSASTKTDKASIDKRDAFRRIMKDLQEGRMPNELDLNSVPLEASLSRDGKPIVVDGVELKMSMHLPTFYFDSVGNAISENAELQAQQAKIHRQTVVQAFINKMTLEAPVTKKTAGKINSVILEDGTFAKFSLSTVFKTDMSNLNFIYADNNGNYLNADGSPYTGLNVSKTPGAVYVVVNKADGSLFPLRLEINNVTQADANMIYDIYAHISKTAENLRQNITEDFIAEHPILSEMEDYLGDIRDLTYAELLNHMVYEGKLSSGISKLAMDLKKGTIAYGDKVVKMSELDKDDFTSWLVTSKRRQVDVKMLDNPQYLNYLDTNKILTSNAVSTDEGHLFIQPVVTYGNLVESRVESKPLEYAEVSEPGEIESNETIEKLTSQLEGLIKLNSMGIDRSFEIKEIEAKIKSLKSTPEASYTSSVKNKKAEIDKQLELLSEDDLYIVHLTTDNNAINIFNSALIMPAGLNSTTNVISKNTLKELLYKLAEGKSTHRGYLDLFIGKISKETVDKQLGRTSSEKIESYIEDNFIDSLAKQQLPRELNFAYFTNGILTIPSLNKGTKIEEVNSKYANQEETVSNIESKKADIERRRQEEIGVKEKRTFTDDEGFTFEVQIHETNDKKIVKITNLSNKASYTETYSKDLSNEKIYEVSNGDEYEYSKIEKVENRGGKLTDSINAKYDAELAALEQKEVKPTETTEQSQADKAAAIREAMRNTARNRGKSFKKVPEYSNSEVVETIKDKIKEISRKAKLNGFLTQKTTDFKVLQSLMSEVNKSLGYQGLVLESVGNEKQLVKSDLKFPLGVVRSPLNLSIFASEKYKAFENEVLEKNPNADLKRIFEYYKNCKL
jgi:hypothetical protein